jgi:hypothetical protein
MGGFFIQSHLKQKKYERNYKPISRKNRKVFK